MREAISGKWNRRYREAKAPNQPTQVLVENLHLLPQQGIALELACGLGGNALLLARKGLTTHAWDISAQAITKLQQFAQQQALEINARIEDLQRCPPPCSSFDIICVSGFLDRALCPAIIAALKPGGLLYYQTHTRNKVTDSGPSNPEFLLEQGELLKLFAPLRPVVYREEEGCGNLDQGLRNQAYLVAQQTT
jgi:SAM-dependent methyltransferase